MHELLISNRQNKCEINRKLVIFATGNTKIAHTNSVATVQLKAVIYSELNVSLYYLTAQLF